VLSSGISNCESLEEKDILEWASGRGRFCAVWLITGQT